MKSMKKATNPTALAKLTDEEYSDNYLACLKDSGEVVYLVDISGSMYDDAKVGGTKREQALAAIRDREGLVVSFGSHEAEADEPVDISVVVRDEGTPMCRALKYVRESLDARMVVLVSDGMPTDGTNQDAFEQALRLGVPVNTIYVEGGDGLWSFLEEKDEKGVKITRKFMESIANATGGYARVVGEASGSVPVSLKQEMEQAVEELALPALPAGKRR